MPPKRRIKRAKSAPKQNKNNVSSAELTQITKMLKNMNQPQSQVTDLGRMLLKGGNMASSMFGFPKIFGSGSYAMTNTLWNASQQVPIMHSSNESVRIKHREYIADVSMVGPNYTAVTYAVNPGLSTAFPYLSAVAANFQEYSFKGLVYEFKTTSATSLTTGTNTAMGSVMLAAQYRADAPSFTSKTQLLNEMWSVDTVPSSSIVLPVECAPAETVLPMQYVRTGSVTGDIKLFDLATITVATQGGQSGQNNVVGELWVSYDVELRKPQVSSLSGGATGSVFEAIGNTWTTASLFNSFLPAASSTLNVTLSGNSIVFPQGAGGYYFVDVSFTFSPAATGACSLTYSFCHAASNNVNLYGGVSTASTSNTCNGIVILVTAPANNQAVVNISGTWVPTATGVGTVLITSLPNLPSIWGI
jgi:hypothetical protein